MPAPIRLSLHDSVQFLKALDLPKPAFALILGSGLGDFADAIRHPKIIAGKDIPGYPTSTVYGHAGTLVFGRIQSDGRTSPPLLVFKGRVHFYETGSLDRTVAPVRLAHSLGIRKLIITNAAGAINRSFVPGDLMLIRDVISIHPACEGPIPRRTLPREPVPFDRRLTNLMSKVSREQGIALREGTYCWMKGPSYETASEVRMMGILGADAVGMSTVPEVMEARNLGMQVVGVSLISNLATGVSEARLTHAEVTETGKRAAGRFTRLISTFLTTH